MTQLDDCGGSRTLTSCRPPLPIRESDGIGKVCRVEGKVPGVAEVAWVNLNVAGYDQTIVGFTPDPVDNIVEIIGTV